MVSRMVCLVLLNSVLMLLVWITAAPAQLALTSESTSAEDDEIDMLPAVHVHGLRLHAGQQRSPIPLRMPWPTIPPSLLGEPLDAWMRVRFLVKATGEATVVILEPADHRELTLAAVDVLERWTFLPQMDGDTPVDGELTVKIHFRTP